MEPSTILDVRPTCPERTGKCSKPLLARHCLVPPRTTYLRPDGEEPPNSPETGLPTLVKDCLGSCFINGQEHGANTSYAELEKMNRGKFLSLIHI